MGMSDRMKEFCQGKKKHLLTRGGFHKNVMASVFKFFCGE